jgi:hypothetical protein
MTEITVDTPIVLAPATQAVTTSSFTVLYIEENYGWDTVDPSIPRPMMGMARPASVMAEVLLSSDPWITRRIVVWEGADYLAVRGTWTDQDLFQKVGQILTNT